METVILGKDVKIDLKDKKLLYVIKKGNKIFFIYKQEFFTIEEMKVVK